MRVPLLRRQPREPLASGVFGVARVDARTKNLTKRLQHGEIAVIEHLDIDKVSAEALIACHPGGRHQRGGQHERALPEPRSRRSWSTAGSR